MDGKSAMGERTETAIVVFDSERLSYRALLEVFFQVYRPELDEGIENLINPRFVIPVLTDSNDVTVREAPGRISTPAIEAVLPSVACAPSARQTTSVVPGARLGSQLVGVVQAPSPAAPVQAIVAVAQSAAGPADAGPDDLAPSKNATSIAPKTATTSRRFGVRISLMDESAGG